MRAHYFVLSSIFAAAFVLFCMTVHGATYFTGCDRVEPDIVLTWHSRTIAPKGSRQACGEVTWVDQWNDSPISGHHPHYTARTLNSIGFTHEQSFTSEDAAFSWLRATYCKP